MVQCLHPSTLATKKAVPRLIKSAKKKLAIKADDRPDPAAVDCVWVAVKESTSVVTKATDRSDWVRFERWETATGHQVLPAPPAVVAAYLATAAKKRRADGRPVYGLVSLTRWVSSINQVHTAAGLPAPGRSQVVRRTLAGERRTRRSPPKRRSRLRLTDVRTLLEAMRPSMSVWPAAIAAHRDAAILLMGFVGAARRSELVNLRTSDVTSTPRRWFARPGLLVHTRPTGAESHASSAVRAGSADLSTVRGDPLAVAATGLQRRWRAGGDGPDQRASRSTEHHCCVDDATATGRAEDIDDHKPAGERWLFPTVHKTGRPSKVMTGEAVAAMIQRRAAAAGFTAAQVDLPDSNSLEGQFITATFDARADTLSASGESATDFSDAWLSIAGRPRPRLATPASGNIQADRRPDGRG